MKKSVNSLRKIRNDFAHTATKISFKAPSIKDRAKALSTLSKKMLRDDTKAYFMRSMTTILTAINMKLESFERCSTPENFNIEMIDKGLKQLEDSISKYKSSTEQ